MLANCRCYMKLHDTPTKSSTEENDEMSKLPPAQRKKLRQKQKKAEARAKRVIWKAHHRPFFPFYLQDQIINDHLVFWFCPPYFLQEAEEKQEDETASSNSTKPGKKQNARPVDLDPHGEKLIQVLIFLAMPYVLMSILSVFSACTFNAFYSFGKAFSCASWKLEPY